MDRQVRYEDVAGLNSRVSWGAIFAGSAIAIAVYLMLSLFFAGVGLSAADANTTDAQTAGWLTLAAGAIALIGSLFLGGYVTTVLTAGENRQEAIIHGVLTWAVVTVLAASALGSALRAGASAAMNTGMIASNAANSGNGTAGQNLADAARRVGVPEDRINEAKNATNPDNIRANAENARAQMNDPQNREEVRRTAARTAWVTLGATLLSIGAAVWGALAGAGPTFRLFPVAVAERRDVTTSTTAVRS